MLKEGQYLSHMEEQVTRRTTELEAKVRELGSLNQLYQTEISERFASEEATYLKMHSSKETRLRRGMMVLQELEKRRISEYLLGPVQSRLQLLRERLYQCQEILGVEPEKVLGWMEEIEAEVRTIQEDDIRQASHRLYPSVARLGLAPALRSLRDRFGQVASVELRIQAELESAGENKWRSFPEELGVAVYRIVEEALDNVVKHAQVQRASVELYYLEDGQIALKISDCGRGFSLNGAQGSGLPVMRGYAEALGGSCRIESSPERGTIIHVVLPVPGDASLSGQRDEDLDR